MSTLKRMKVFIAIFPLTVLFVWNVLSVFLSFYFLAQSVACTPSPCEAVGSAAFGIRALHHDLLESEVLIGENLSSYLRLSSRVDSGEVPDVLLDAGGIYFKILEPAYTRSISQCIQSEGYSDVVEWLKKSGTMDEFALLPSVKSAHATDLPVPIQYACIIYIYNSAEMQR